MEPKDEELLKKLLPMFKIEAQDHLKVISSGLNEIEKSESQNHPEIIETIYRESHSLKGAARSVNRSDIVAICQSMENVFSALKSEEIAPASRILELLHQAVDRASDLITELEISHAEKSGVGEIIRKLEEAALQKHSVSGRKRQRIYDPIRAPENMKREKQRHLGLILLRKPAPSFPRLRRRSYPPPYPREQQGFRRQSSMRFFSRLKRCFRLNSPPASSPLS